MGNGGWEGRKQNNCCGAIGRTRKLGRRRHRGVRWTRHFSCRLREFRIIRRDRPKPPGGQSRVGGARISWDSLVSSANWLHRQRARLALLHSVTCMALHRGPAPAGTGIAALWASCAVTTSSVGNVCSVYCGAVWRARFLLTLEKGGFVDHGMLGVSDEFRGKIGDPWQPWARNRQATPSNSAGDPVSRSDRLVSSSHSVGS